MGVLYMCVYSVAKLPQEQHILAALICPVSPCWGENIYLALWTCQCFFRLYGQIRSPSSVLIEGLEVPAAIIPTL